MSNTATVPSQVETDGVQFVDDEVASQIAGRAITGADDQAIKDFRSMTQQERNALLEGRIPTSTTEIETPPEVETGEEETETETVDEKESENPEEKGSPTKDKARINMPGMSNSLRSKSLELMKDDPSLTPYEAEVAARKELNMPPIGPEQTPKGKEKSGEEPAESARKDDAEDVDFSSYPEVSSIEKEIKAAEKELAEAQEELDSDKQATALRKLGRLDSKLETAKERVAASIQEATTRFETERQASQDRAFELFPDASVEDSPLRQKAEELHAQFVTEGRAIVDDPDYPEYLTRKAADALGIAPKSSTPDQKGGDAAKSTKSESSAPGEKSKPPFSPPTGSEGGRSPEKSQPSLTPEQVVAEIRNADMSPGEKSALLTQALEAGSQAELAAIRAKTARGSA